MSQTPNPELITIGRIISAFGIRGWVELVSFTEPESNLFTFVPWQLFDERKPAAPPFTVKVISHKPHKQKTDHHTWVAQLAECTDRDQALALRGVYIKVPRSQLPALGANEYYWTDLEGLAVYNLEKKLLGHVEHLFATGSNDVLVVKNAAKTLYIPYVLPEVVKLVDLQEKYLIVDWEL